MYRANRATKRGSLAGMMVSLPANAQWHKRLKHHLGTSRLRPPPRQPLRATTTPQSIHCRCTTLGGFGGFGFQRASQLTPPQGSPIV